MLDGITQHRESELRLRNDGVRHTEYHRIAIQGEGNHAEPRLRNEEILQNRDFGNDGILQRSDLEMRE